jgi:1D-myo-inositol 3-kinase
VATSPTAGLLVLGHVTCDEIGADRRLGGAASFAARAAVALGARVDLVTAAPPRWPLLAELAGLEGLTMHLRPSEVVTTFRLDYQGGGRRRITLRAAAPPLTAADVPPSARRAPVVYVGPVIGECDRALVESLGTSPFVCAGLQGWLRRPGPDGEIASHLSPEVLAPPANLRAAVFSEEDHGDAEVIAARLAGAGLIVAVTRGARGATVLSGVDRWDVRASPAREIDPTGAGDVFGVVFALGLACGGGPEEAGRAAARAAARVVEGPGLGTLVIGTRDGIRG